MSSSIYPQAVTLAATPIAASTNILSSDIEIDANQLTPGGGGTLRLLFGMDFAVSPSSITVTNSGSSKGTLNADNSSQIVDNGYYRFDIDVEAGDKINLQSSQQVDSILFLRAHLVLFGA